MAAGNEKKPLSNAAASSGGKSASMQKAEALKPYHDALLASLWEAWGAHLPTLKNKPEIDMMVFTKMAVVTVSQMAAVLAVDTMMTQDQFMKVCAANFAECYDAAPKFGA